MNTEKTNDNKDKTTGPDLGCNPEEFKGMFEMMGECCKTQGGFPDCEAMMKTVMANCFKIENNK
jgi:hypothetical protein